MVNYCIVVPWHNQDQLARFLEAWKIHSADSKHLVFQQDKNKEGCAVTKNKGIIEALHRDADVIIVIDDDCYPDDGMILETFVGQHLAALEPCDVQLYECVTDPPSRGTPYFTHSIKMPVAASMGFWVENPDYDAVSTLAMRKTPLEMTFRKKAMFWRFFAFSGMNCAFKRELWPHFKFDESAPRFDDIFMGYWLQAEAYKRGYCINLRGPTVNHVRQSNVWDNLKVESENLERNETEWTMHI